MRALILDFDGTIVDSEPLHGEALTSVLAPLGLSLPPDGCIGLPDADAFHAVFAHAGRPFDPDQLHTLLERKSAAAEKLWRAGRARPYPGAIDIIRESFARNIPVAVCTAALRREAAPVLRSLGVLPLLAAFTTADDVSRSKPDPACYTHTCARLGLPPADCTAIEDSVAGTTSARAAGCRVIAVGHTTPAAALTAAHEHVTAIADLNALFGWR